MDTLSLLKQQVAGARRELNGVMQGVTQEIGNWQPPGLANSIVDLYFHTVSAQDRLLTRLEAARPTLIDKWADRLKIPADFRHTPEASRALRADISTLSQYGEAVFADVDKFIGSLTAADMERMVDGARGPVSIVTQIAALLATHTYEHIGEISAMKGVQGAKGYATA